jgi:hypothetical protein
MAVRFDDKTLERLRSLDPDEAFREVRNAVYAHDDVGSEDFLSAYEQLVERGILSWEQVEELEERR